MTEDKIDVSQVRLLEITRHARRLRLQFHKDYLSADDMADLMTPLCAEPGIFDKWNKKLMLIKKIGVIELRKKNPQIAASLDLNEDACPDVDILNQNQPWLIPSVHEDFIGECRKQFNLTLNGLDTLTRVGGFAFTEDEDKSSDNFDLYNPDVFISWHGKGTKATLKGPIKHGKTNAGLWMDEQFIRKKIDVMSNILVPHPPEGYYYCAKLSGLLTNVCKANMNKHEVNITMDEANLFFAKVDTVRPRNIDLSKLVLCFGKMHASLLFISHYQSLIPTVVAQTAIAEFEKLSLKTMKAEIRQGTKLTARVIKDWPATTLEYSPDQLQWFSMDMDVEGLFNFMANLEDVSDQWKDVMEYVDQHKDEMEDADVDPKMIAQWLRRKGKSVPEIARIIERPRRTVQDWVQGIG